MGGAALQALRVGVAGWDYADWVGTVFPSGHGPRFDRLAWIARFVDLVEVNATFYRPIVARTAVSWLRRTQEQTRFAFSAKAHRSWTHEQSPDLDRVVAATLEGLRPIHEAGRLAALLAQFPQSFRPTDAARRRVEQLVRRCTGWPLVVELRHAGWLEGAAQRWFAGLGAGWCVVDQPAASGTVARPLPYVHGRLAYLRLHGRNVADWFREDAGRDLRYDYLYDPAELDELAGIARELAVAAQELVVVQNNHFRGQALVNALQLRSRLEGRKPEAPQSLVAAFPQLADEVSVRRTLLF